MLTLDLIKLIYPDLAGTINESEFDALRPKSVPRSVAAKINAERKDKLKRMLGYQRKYSIGYYAKCCDISVSTASRWIKDLS